MTTRTLIGIDVAKAELVIARSDDSTLQSIHNTPAAIRKWRKSLPDHCSIAVEPTSTYHRELLAQCHAAGHQLYLVDGFQVSNYRKSLRGRTKTDACDARLLLRFLSSEESELRPWSPPGSAYEQLQGCLRRRAQLVKARTLLHQSFRSDGAQDEIARVIRELNQAIRQLTLKIQQVIKEANLQASYSHCQQIPGIGPVTAAGLLGSYLRGYFRKSDAFIAFLGLDVCARDSGTYQGRRRLSKQGNPEIRRLLYNAAMAAKKQPEWAGYYQRYVDRGLKPTQALVILARKLARVAFAVIRNGQPFKPTQQGLTT